MPADLHLPDSTAPNDASAAAVECARVGHNAAGVWAPGENDYHCARCGVALDAPSPDAEQPKAPAAEPLERAQMEAARVLGAPQHGPHTFACEALARGLQALCEAVAQQQGEFAALCEHVDSAEQTRRLDGVRVQATLHAAVVRDRDQAVAEREAIRRGRDEVIEERDQARADAAEMLYSWTGTCVASAAVMDRVRSYARALTAQDSNAGTTHGGTSTAEGERNDESQSSQSGTNVQAAEPKPEPVS